MFCEYLLCSFTGILVVMSQLMILSLGPEGRHSYVIVWQHVFRSFELGTEQSNFRGRCEYNHNDFVLRLSQVDGKIFKHFNGALDMDRLFEVQCVKIAKTTKEQKK